MTRQEYLNELKLQLTKLPAAEVEEILADYHEHFEMGQRSGKTESEIYKSLGAPRAVAQGYLVSSLVEEAKVSPSLSARLKILARIMMMFLILAPFNFLVLVGPFLILLALTLAGWAVPLAVGGVSIAVVAAYLSATGDLSIGILQGMSFFFMFLGCLGLTGLGMLLMFWVSKFLTQLIASYLRWNFNFITARRI